MRTCCAIAGLCPLGALGAAAAVAQTAARNPSPGLGALVEQVEAFFMWRFSFPSG